MTGLVGFFLRPVGRLFDLLANLVPNLGRRLGDLVTGRLHHRLGAGQKGTWQTIEQTTRRNDERREGSAVGASDSPIGMFCASSRRTL